MGYRETGGQFFGSPGASADCNINIACSQGNNWRDEQNAVAILLVNDGEGTCTGTLVTNTCGSNTPYVLTANHCLGGNLANWVFQYKYWSETCSPNSGWSEDIQFNGCQLRANDCELDFALVQMNQVPPVSSGITYAGWSRDTTPATSGATIHHPRGDLMKISIFNTPAASVPWAVSAPNNPCPSLDSNHWRVSFNQGIVQHGSSGAALFNQDKRIVGQLHGNQNNTCSTQSSNSCWCITQIPAIGEYGRFDISWGKDASGNFLSGRNASNSLATWLDPGNTNAMTTNTIAIANIIGPSLLCTSETYTITNVPSGATVTGWSAAPTGAASFSGSGNSRSITRVGDFCGEVTITVTLSTDCGNIEVERKIWVGPPLIEDIGYPSSSVEPDELIPLSITPFPASQSNSNYKAVINRVGGGFSDTVQGNIIEFSLPSPGVYNVYVYAMNACGWPDESYFYPLVFFCSNLLQGPLFAVAQDAEKDILKVSMPALTEMEPEFVQSVQSTYRAVLYDSSGQQILAAESKDGGIVFETGKLDQGTYTLHIIYNDAIIEKREVKIGK